MPVDWEKVERLRRLAKKNQQQAAEEIGLSGKSHWSNIVTGKQDVTSKQLDAIARLLNVKVQALWK